LRDSELRSSGVAELRNHLLQDRLPVRDGVRDASGAAKLVGSP
jgi:hypothetical protein